MDWPAFFWGLGVGAAIGSLITVMTFWVLFGVIGDLADAAEHDAHWEK